MWSGSTVLPQPHLVAVYDVGVNLPPLCGCTRLSTSLVYSRPNQLQKIKKISKLLKMISIECEKFQFLQKIDHRIRNLGFMEETSRQVIYDESHYTLESFEFSAYPGPDDVSFVPIQSPSKSTLVNDHHNVPVLGG